MLRSAVFVLVFVSLASAQVFAQVRVDALALEQRLTGASGRQYDLLLRTLKQQGLVFDVEVLPIRRLALKVHQSPGGCIFPINLKFLSSSYFSREVAAREFVSGDVVDYVSLRVFTAPGVAQVTDVGQLLGKRISYRGGDDMKVLLPNVTAEVVKTRSHLSRLRMLSNGRLDAVIGYVPDVLLAAHRSGLDMPRFDKGLNLSFHHEGVGFVCHDTLKARAFLDRFNFLLRDMRASGKLREIFGATVALEG